MTTLETVLVGALFCIAFGSAAALLWLTNQLERRVANLEKRLHALSESHDLLASETRQALKGWSALFNPGAR